jgi:hypothetical protein
MLAQMSCHEACGAQGQGAAEVAGESRGARLALVGVNGAGKPAACTQPQPRCLNTVPEPPAGDTCLWKTSVPRADGPRWAI